MTSTCGTLYDIWCQGGDSLTGGGFSLNFFCATPPALSYIIRAYGPKVYAWGGYSSMALTMVNQYEYISNGCDYGADEEISWIYNPTGTRCVYSVDICSGGIGSGYSGT